MSNNFKTGDVVKLKSDGPKMTVTRVEDNGVWCTWFAGKKNEKSFFPFDALLLVSDDEKDA